MRSSPMSAIGMRLNVHASDSLVLLQCGRAAPTVLPAQAAATFTVNSADDHDDKKCDAADCALREAILAANANAGPGLIVSRIPDASGFCGERNRPREDSAT